MIVYRRSCKTRLACLRPALRVVWPNPKIYVELLSLRAALCEPYESLPARRRCSVGEHGQWALSVDPAGIDNLLSRLLSKRTDCRQIMPLERHYAF